MEHAQNLNCVIEKKTSLSFNTNVTDKLLTIVYTFDVKSFSPTDLSSWYSVDCVSRFCLYMDHMETLEHVNCKDFTQVNFGTFQF